MAYQPDKWRPANIAIARLLRLMNRDGLELQASDFRLQTSETQDELDLVFADSKTGVVRPADGSQLCKSRRLGPGNDWMVHQYSRGDSEVQRSGLDNRRNGVA